MDDYDRKLRELRTYVPFLTKMIDKLEKAGDKSKEAQLAKMKSLKGILTASDKKLRLDTLIKCEDVLHKLYEKVEGVPGPQSQPQNQPQQQQDRGSLSSYLQQIHDNQFREQQGQPQPFRDQGFNDQGPNFRQQPRFQGHQGPRRPNPWLNNDQPHPQPWQRPPFQDHWADNRGGHFQHQQRPMHHQQQPQPFQQQPRFPHPQQHHQQQQQGFQRPFFQNQPQQRFPPMPQPRSRWDDQRHPQRHPQMFHDHNSRFEPRNHHQSQFNERFGQNSRNSPPPQQFERFARKPDHPVEVNPKREFVKEWNKGVRGPVIESPRSPGPVQEDMDTPKSPDPEENLMTPASPVMETPMSPKADEEDENPLVIDTPMSPTNDDTPASPSPPVEEVAAPVKFPKKDETKVIPLERDPRQYMKSRPQPPPVSDLDPPKDWARCLKSSVMTASPSSEASDDSLKKVSESPASSSPASPASGETLMNKPVLPTPVPARPVQMETTHPPKKPMPQQQRPQMEAMHPSRPVRPPHSMNTKNWSHPRLPQPLPVQQPQRPPFQPQRPHVSSGHQQQQPPKKPLTYGEYRKLKEEADRKNRVVASQPPVIMNRRDPRRQPKVIEQPPVKPLASTSQEPQPTGKFKIPKKKKPEAAEAVEPPKPKIETAIVRPASKEEEAKSEQSESDSEPELKIAESSDNEDANDQSAVKIEDTSKPDEVEEKKEEDKGQLTKAMLQNIVASIDTKEATKLLERATKLLNREDGHKLSLKELLVGDSSDSETEEPIVAPRKAEKATSYSGGGKKAANKPVKKAPTPGTRRSRRLQTPEKEEEEEEEKIEEPLLDDDDDDDDNQLVIDEAPPSSSEDDAVVAPKKVKGRPPKASVVDVKSEVQLEQPKPMKSPAPKSKTWFPGSFEKKSPGHVFKSPKPEVKREPKELDMKVFEVSESMEISDEFLSKKVDTTIDVKSRIAIDLNTSLLAKTKDDEGNETAKQDQRASQSELKNPDHLDLSQILREPLPDIMITDDYTQDELGLTREALANIDYDGRCNDNFEEEPLEFNSFIQVIKQINNQESSALGQSWRDLSKAETKGLDGLSSTAVHAEGGVNLAHLFKCMSQFCNFTTDLAQEFRSHLHSSHGNDKRKHRHGWLKCCHCLRKLANPDYLANHIVRFHGSQQHFQCPHCFYRDSSQWSLLLHQQQDHPGLEESTFLATSYLEKTQKTSSSKLPPLSAAVNANLQCQTCGLQCDNAGDLSNHLFLDHTNVESHQDHQCGSCLVAFPTFSRLLLHSRLVHRKKATNPMIIRTIDQVLKFDPDEEPDDDINENDEKVECIEENIDLEGLIGRELFKCGNEGCPFSAENVADFRDHVAICDLSSFLTCYHCKKQSKHVATLVDHLKTHGLKRYSCSLCTFKSSVPLYVKNHLRLSHNVPQTKVVAIDCLKTNPDRDLFIVMPKNAMPKGNKGKTPDTFSPSEIDLIPPVSMSRHLMRCSVCDFVSKVRMNLVKHLQLHLKDKEVPFITPVNPVEVLEVSSFSRMTVLLDLSDEEKVKQLMSEEDYYKMPKLVAENQRYACPSYDCNYVSVDAIMLVAHIQHIHPEFHEQYRCPHCPQELNIFVPFDEVEFHLRCHGDLLFKCYRCLYYHWQKRTAERHVAETHPGAKIHVKDVRQEGIEMAKKKDTKKSGMKKPEPQKKPLASDTPPVLYQPYKCGLCDLATETLESIRDHCSKVHEIACQFKCSLCDVASDNKSQVESHCEKVHKSAVMMRIFYVDPSTTSSIDLTVDEKREPLWRRDMPGLKHIRGILYEEYQTQQPKEVSVKKATVEKSSDEVDNFPMKCKECGLQKKTIKGLKMHIKLLHLRTGKFLCKKCHFSANMLNSIHTHNKIKHPNDNPDFEERTDDKMNFSHDFWKESWGIPTLAERKELVKEKMVHSSGLDIEQEDITDVIPVNPVGKKRKLKPGRKVGSGGSSKKMKKRGIKRKAESLEEIAPQDQPVQAMGDVDVEKPLSVMEISPFEHVMTYKCQFCSKRTNMLDKIESHLKVEHPSRNNSMSEEECGYKILTRDHVVDLLTLTATTANAGEFICYFCEDVVGSIHDIKAHFSAEHDQLDSFKVKRVQDGAKKPISGYLECQLCGYLSPGFDRSKQRVHFNEEHPLEQSINCSKYVTRSKNCKVNSEPVAFVAFDPLKYLGMNMKCPKEECTFENTSNAAMNAHLRKHTQTFKCGHCGKTHPNSSEFHRHSAMIHGDKIPDLVKDPEAEAAFEALRGLVEADLQKEFDLEQERKKQLEIKAKLKKPTARKSTAAATAGPRPKKATARKSTGQRNFFSYYGIPQQPVDFNDISTRMSIGGMEITLNASKMAGLVNLKPKVLVKDCHRESVV